MDNAKLEYLLKEHHQSAFMWANQCCQYQEEDAKDVLQVVYLKVLEGEAKYKGKSSFKTWLFSVIRFTAIDYLKKKVSFENIENMAIISDTGAETEEEAIDYKKTLSELPERQQQVLLLAFYHDMTLAQIADVTGLHIGTIRTHYERGKGTLRSLILKEKV